MTQIKYIEDTEGNKIFPITHERAVRDSNGTTIESKLQMQTELINQAQMEIGAVPSDNTPTENSTNWVTSDGIYKSVKQVNDRTVVVNDEEVFLGNWTRSSSKSSFVEGDEHSVVITASSSSSCRIGFEITCVGAGKELHISYDFVKTTTNSGSWGIGATMSASWATLVPISGSVSLGAELSGSNEFAFIVPSGTQYIYLSATNFYDGSEQTLTISNFKAWSVQPIKEYVDETVDVEVEKGKYGMSQLDGTWSSNDTSRITATESDGNITINVITSTTYKRAGFSIADVKVGEKVYVDFYSNSNIVFGVGEALDSTWINVGTFYKSFYFTKTSTSQKYLYVPANSYSAGTVLVLHDFKAYKCIGINTLDQRLEPIESYAFMPSSYIPIKERYENYMSISATSGQGSTIYGNYFVNAFAESAKIKIYNLSTKELVQQVTLPTFANTRFHANTISFSGTKYDSGDDFPLLYICSGYTDTTSVSTSEVYVVRIVGTSGSYTSELIQTITLDFGIVNGWTEFVCDPVKNRAWINGSGIAKYIYVALPTTTESEVTIDANTTIIDKFDTKTFTLGLTTKSSGQGRFFYHNRIYWVSGVPSYTGEGDEALYVCVDNTLTHCTEAVVPLKNFGLASGTSNTYEPEGCFIWNDDFYVAYRSFIAKLIQN